jgi:hypothetical protein
VATKLIELWIISRDGLTFLHTQGKGESDSKVASFLFSGFLSALETMAAESIDAIKMKDSKIIIVPEKQPIKMFFVARANAKEKDENIRKVLYKIRDGFVAEYRAILPTWGGQTDIFDYFEKRLQNEYIE